VVVVPDVGIDPALIRTAAANLEGSVKRPVPSFDAFIAALDSLGPALAAAMPRRDDDVNELPDDMGVG
ncbi:MAG TPA: hypothetical protein VM925_11840, partial [Labilithrix sp.]|nr:hypothetical protein [Labilithrix sp.]